VILAALPHREIALPLIDRITESIVGVTALVFLAAFVWVSKERDKREQARWVEHTKAIVDMQIKHAELIRAVQGEADARSLAYIASVEKLSDRWRESIRELAVAIERREAKS
jgi:hypothetical protein